MNKLMTAYLLKGRRTIVTDKALVINATDDEFEEVTLILSQEEIDRYSKEIKVFVEYEKERLEELEDEEQ